MTISQHEFALVTQYGVLGDFAAVIDKDLSAPPGSPATGDAYIVAAGPTGAWTGKAGQIAYWVGREWWFCTPSEGWRVEVADEHRMYRYDGSGWALGEAPTASPAGVAWSVSATAPAQITTAQAGVAASVAASAAVAGSSVAGAAAGGSATVTAGNAARLTSGDANGGDINLVVGAGVGTGTAGQVLTGDGVNSRPSYAFTNDRGTGMFLVSSGVLGISAGNSQRVRVTAGVFRTTLQLQFTTAIGSSGDVAIERSAAGVLEVNNSTTGTFRDVKLRNLLAGGGNGSYVQTPSMTVANLASAATAGLGALATVSDANATTRLSVVAGGGSNKVVCFSDGTNWLIL